MCIFWKVKKQKREIWETFIKFKEQDWATFPAAERAALIDEIGGGLALYLTKLTDYIADEKHKIKDTAI